MPWLLKLVHWRRMLCTTTREPKWIDQSSDIDLKPFQKYTFKLFEPCIVIHCAPLGPEVVTGACLTASGHEMYHSHHERNSLAPINLSHMDSLAPLQSTDAQSRYLLADNTRAQTNWPILRYWWKTITKLGHSLLQKKKGCEALSSNGNTRNLIY